MKLPPDEAKLFHVDGRTDRHEPNNRFSKFLKRT